MKLARRLLRRLRGQAKRGVPAVAEATKEVLLEGRGGALDPDCRPPVFPSDRLVPTRRQDVFDKLDDGELKLWLHGWRDVLSLNEAGRAIWAMCDGGKSVAEICEGLRGDFNADDRTLRHDTAAVLNLLRSRGLVSFRENPEDAMATTIDLRQIPTFVINRKSEPVRREAMLRQMEPYGLRFDFVDAMECKPGNVGTAISHLRILRRKDLATPFLILEDDCKFNENFRHEYSLPQNCDALYLGVSHFGNEFPGRLSWGKWGGVRWSHYGADYLRVYNMLGRHAIVYLSERFRQAVVVANIEALTNSEHFFPGDVGTASTHALHLVLTPLKPACFQSGDIGGNQPATDRALVDR